MKETVGRLGRPGGEEIAWRRIEGAGPTVVWLGGFASDMAGTKAQALAGWAAAKGRSFLRFDYLGHGESSGDFRDGTISLWREDALEAIDRLSEGPLILVGSSMGGWIACLAALARPDRVAGLVLVAPAPDFTEKLMKPALPEAARRAIETQGVWISRSGHEPEGMAISRALLEDGARWSILDGPIAIAAPVRILQGGRDADVPWEHGLRLAQALESSDLVFSLVKDGDHRLSRPQDLERLVAAVEQLMPRP
jgi:pimeloyl-ACP methyl ester carboxylesterase